MSDVIEEPTDIKRAFIREVFIKPVRSVLVVDDGFPTLDALMQGYCEDGDQTDANKIWLGSNEEAKTNAPRLNGLLKYCRSSDREWIVDVHDGQNIEFVGEEAVAKRLRQCDVMVLDYMLDGDDHVNGPAKAIRILKDLAESEHFNLVVLYTKEDADLVFREISKEFLQPWKNIQSTGVDESLKDNMEAWEAGTLIDCLESALGNWSPNPNRLIASMFVSELDKRGFRPNDPAFSDEPMQALWVKTLLSKNGAARKTEIGRAIVRYIDHLRVASISPVQDFAQRLIESIDNGAESDAIVKVGMGVDLKDAAIQRSAKIQHNRYVCSQPVEGYHLSTGHVFQIGDELWVCLTPACDLEVRDDPNRRGEHYSPVIPFKAVQLHPASKSTALKKVNTGLFVFLKIDGCIRPHSFVIDGDEQAAPFWLEMYIHDQSRFREDGTLSVYFPKPSEEYLPPQFEDKEAKIVAQLRYEYAINLMQKLGANLSRVGLDFL